MAHGAPDWTEQVQVVIVEAEAKDETAITQLDRLSTSSTSYGTVVSWTVTTDKIGVLHCVEMESDNYVKTRFQLTIAGVVQFTDIQIEASLSLEYPDVKIAAGSEVLLEAKSSDGTAINVDGDILGKEVG